MDLFDVSEIVVGDPFVPYGAREEATTVEKGDKTRVLVALRRYLSVLSLADKP